MKNTFYRTLLLLASHIIYAQSINKPNLANDKFINLINSYEVSNMHEKAAAASFIVNNLHIHYSEDNSWLDHTGKIIYFNALDYNDIESAAVKFKIIQDSLKMRPSRMITEDISKISPEYLQSNINLAFASWKKYPWSKSYNFGVFCEYILPYRSLTEPIQEWRSEYNSIYEQLTGGLADDTDPVEMCSKIITNIKHFDFVLKRFDPKPLLGPKELLFWRQGNCPDLANVAVFAARSLGIAVTVDFTPHFAASSNRHYWNTVIDKDGKFIPFNGNQDLPFAYNANLKRLGKVFRITYSEQAGTLADLLPPDKIPEESLRFKNIVDVTQEYVAVTDVRYKFENPFSGISYINVFNKGAWRTLYWSVVKDGAALFPKMGRNIVYLISTNNGQTKFENYAILLDKDGQQSILKPDFTRTYTASLSRSNEIRNEYTDNNPFQIVRGEHYKLYTWIGKWQLVEESTAIDDDNIIFKKIPESGLLLMSPTNPDFYERIFVVDRFTFAISWY